MYPTRLLSPWISPGKNSGVGYHALLQEIFLTWDRTWISYMGRQILYHLSHQGSPRIYLFINICVDMGICILVCMEVQIYSPIWSRINSLYVFSRDSLLIAILWWFARNKHIWTCENWTISLVLKYWYILIPLCRQGRACARTHTHTHTHTHTIVILCE